MSNEIKLQLENWRGYSAYELAKKHGFAGTEQEWLASLKGRDGGVASVNGIGHDASGNVNISAENLPVGPDDRRAISVVVQDVDKLSGAIKVDEESIDVGGKYIDNARFR